jgi:hypothetical protein
MADGNSTPNLEPRVAVLEQIAADTRDALIRIEHRFDTTDKRIEAVGAQFETRFNAFERWYDGRLDSLERRFEALDKRQHTNLLWLLTGYLAGYAGMLGVMAHGFHWI